MQHSFLTEFLTRVILISLANSALLINQSCAFLEERQKKAFEVQLQLPRLSKSKLFVVPCFLIQLFLESPVNNSTTQIQHSSRLRCRKYSSSRISDILPLPAPVNFGFKKIIIYLPNKTQYTLNTKIQWNKRRERFERCSF